MARKSRKKVQLDDLPGLTDATAELDSGVFLAAARPVLAQLADDLLARARNSAGVTRALRRRHAEEKSARRTADSFEIWQGRMVEQVAAAWLLSCVFVRVLEDRGLLGQPRIAGPGAGDSQRLFFELAPSLTERDYLLVIFRELSHLPGVRDIFDARHNPVWKLAPSAAAAQALLGLFRTPSAEAPGFRFGQGDTRFLGDLYQDLSEDVRKRYALLQTPRFVESFILDRTLERAIERFGLEDATLIDPTCGSGHFLLGAFERLFEHRQRMQPGLDAREAARLALDAVFGADVNPYAVAIARFRLTLAFVDRGGYRRIRDVPALPLHLVVGDSLLHNASIQRDFEYMEGQTSKAWRGQEFALEDDAAARDVLHRRYTAVVGNPPYITVKDGVLRDRYREMYRSAAGKYSLAAPFCERFFQLGRPGAHVGQITANSFMKREFGKKLIEEYLPTVNLDIVVNTSGAFIPGHGTPTVLLFGTSEEPQGRDVLTVLAKRGEPSTPADPERGLVWRSVAEHWDEVGFENDYISVMRTERESLGEHPWSLAGGGATELKQLLEERAEKRLGEIATAIGFDAIMGEDDIFCGPADWIARLGAAERHVRSFCEGMNIRDWAIETSQRVLFPYDGDLEPELPQSSSQVRCHFWKYRTTLINRQQFGKNTIEAGLQWFEYRSFYKSKRKVPLSIAFAFVATHNHFVLDRGGKVFNRSAPIIKLPETATEDDHLALLAYLNSSTACFWMKQVFFEKSSQNYVGDVRDKPERIHYEFAGTPMKSLPVPKLLPSCQVIASRLQALADERIRVAPSAIIQQESFRDLNEFDALLTAGEERHAALQEQMVFLQEELDWQVYVSVGLATSEVLADDDMIRDQKHRIASEHRPSVEETALPADSPLAALWKRRQQACSKNRSLATIEQPLYKRPWLGTQGVFHRDAWTYAALAKVAVENELLSAIEAISWPAAPSPTTQSSILANLRSAPRTHTLLEYLERESDGQDTLAALLARESVPFTSAYVYKKAGMVKHATWQNVWELQRREDAGESSQTATLPPKYKPTDFQAAQFFSLRGKLDVPRERFISYAGCESDEDGEPLYGWAGWNHLQRAQALATIYQQRRTAEDWPAERLVPLLAGLLELIPWLQQWHNDPDPDFDGLKMGDYFAAFVSGQRNELGLTEDNLRAWRPTKKKARRKKATTRKKRKKADPDA